MLFFEQPLSRRRFIKQCAATLLTAGAFGPKLFNFCAGQTLDARRGYCPKQEALYYEKRGSKTVRCTLCPRYCTVVKGKRGYCRVRKNDGGIYYTLAYANPCAVHIDPIEKKPLFHFYPGTTALSLATAGCNFTCKNCQNWEISQARPDDTDNLAITPSQLVELAQKHGSPTIAYTYTEPTVFYEYMLATAEAASKKGIFNIYHSNGYINRDPLVAVAPYLDAANIDLKGFSESFYRDITGGTLEPVLDTLKTLKEKGVWLEITNLLIPGRNDSDAIVGDLCRWIADELGVDVPLHFSRFLPQYKLENIPPTPVETLEKAWRIAGEHGLRYVYIGNVPERLEQNTVCPGCNKTVVRRAGYSVLENRLAGGKCGYCGAAVAGRWN